MSSSDTRHADGAATRLRRAATIGDLRELARRRLARMVFDYIDGAAGEEGTAARGKLTVLIDSGFRTGTDIAKAIALGADGVQLGRATLYGLAAAGTPGARHALAILAQELELAMALCGARHVGELRGRCLAPDGAGR